MMTDLKYKKMVIPIRVIKIITSGNKSIFLVIRSIWMMDGTFKFDDPFGTNDNRLEVVKCINSEWINNQWVYISTTYTDENGYSYFFTDKDTAAAMYNCRIDVASHRRCNLQIK